MTSLRTPCNLDIRPFARSPSFNIEGDATALLWRLKGDPTVFLLYSFQNAWRRRRLFCANSKWASSLGVLCHSKSIERACTASTLTCERRGMTYDVSKRNLYITEIHNGQPEYCEPKDTLHIFLVKAKVLPHFNGCIGVILRVPKYRNMIHVL